MSDFILKVNSDTANIELQGEGDLVYKIFQELKHEGLGQLSTLLSEPKQAKRKEPPKQEESASGDNDHGSNDNEYIGSQQYPSISDIVLKDAPKSETEWVLVYAFYASNFASTPVERETIRGMYHETNRYTEARNKNFATNIKNLSKNGWISALNNDSFIITNAGKTKVKEILFNKSSVSKKATTSNRRSGANVSYSLVDIGLTQEDRDNLNEFYGSYKDKAKSKTDQILVLIYWANKNKLIDEFDTEIVFTLLRTVGENTSFHIPPTLNNMLSRNKYLKSGSTKGKYSITHIGEDRVTHGLVAKE